MIGQTTTTHFDLVAYRAEVRRIGGDYNGVISDVKQKQVGRPLEHLKDV